MMGGANEDGKLTETLNLQMTEADEVARTTGHKTMKSSSSSNDL